MKIERFWEMNIIVVMRLVISVRIMWSTDLSIVYVMYMSFYNQKNYSTDTCETLMSTNIWTWASVPIFWKDMRVRNDRWLWNSPPLVVRVEIRFDSRNVPIPELSHRRGYIWCSWNSLIWSRMKMGGEPHLHPATRPHPPNHTHTHTHLALLYVIASLKWVLSIQEKV
jgi:hypothetical protein